MYGEASKTRAAKYTEANSSSMSDGPKIALPGRKLGESGQFLKRENTPSPLLVPNSDVHLFPLVSL